MAIKRNKRVHEYEFGWEFERASSDQSDLNLDIVYHDTDEYGPTVSIVSQEETILSLPVSFLSEVIAEIELEDERRNLSQKPMTSRKPKVAKTGGIQLPSIKRDASEEAEVESSENARRRDPSLIDESQPPAVSFSKRPARTKPDPKAEKEIMQRAGSPTERLAKRDMPKNEKASIRRSDVE